MSITYDLVTSALKRVAKKLRRENPSLAQSQALDHVASYLGYNNWSLLSKHVRGMSPHETQSFYEQLQQHRNMADMPFGQFDEEEAIREMEEWVRAKFSRLIDFAFYDNESENGFSWPSVDLNLELQEEFLDKYSYELIAKISRKLELDGPWGLEDYGDDEDRLAPYDPELATREMKDWVHRKFSRLVNFAFRDRESDNGYAFPSVELDEKLHAEFSDKYSHELIEKVSQELELEGPWGIENFGNSVPLGRAAS